MMFCHVLLSGGGIGSKIFLVVATGYLQTLHCTTKLHHASIKQQKITATLAITK